MIVLSEPNRGDLPEMGNCRLNYLHTLLMFEQEIISYCICWERYQFKKKMTSIFMLDVSGKKVTVGLKNIGEDSCFANPIQNASNKVLCSAISNTFCYNLALFVIIEWTSLIATWLSSQKHRIRWLQCFSKIQLPSKYKSRCLNSNLNKLRYKPQDYIFKVEKT